MFVDDAHDDSSGFDGLVGLSYGDNDEGNLLIDALYDSGAIEDRVFAVWFTFDQFDNEITFGGWDEDKYPKDDLAWIDVIDDYFWEVEASYVWYGEIKM